MPRAGAGTGGTKAPARTRAQRERRAPEVAAQALAATTAAVARPAAKGPDMEQIRDLALAALNDLKGIDVVCLDVTHLTDFSDYILVATGTSGRHVRALVSTVVEKAKASGVMPLGVEGKDTGEWVLVDLGGVVVNVMQAAVRSYYDLERLWTTPKPAQSEA